MVRTVSGASFLWLILQHVLPKGLRRALNFGFLHPKSKALIALLQVVLKVMPSTDLGWMKPRPPFPCPCCGAPMQVVRRRILSAFDRRRGSSLAEGVRG
ncbi:MAG: family transposase [Proteobacteria bacterium]|nr:family transposase [Pseudomonadota bacterium]